MTKRAHAKKKPDFASLRAIVNELIQNHGGAVPYPVLKKAFLRRGCSYHAFNRMKSEGYVVKTGAPVTYESDVCWVYRIGKLQ